MFTSVISITNTGDRNREGLDAVTAIDLPPEPHAAVTGSASAS
jgi:hypothetical protein